MEHYLYVLGGSRLLAEFCYMLNSLCVQVVFSCIGSITERHWSSGHQPNFAKWYKDGIMELSLLVMFNRGRKLYSEGGQHVEHRPTF